MDDQRSDYTVGYGKPPAGTQFQTGKSGNPGGRPRGTKTLVTLLGEVLSQRSGLPRPDGSSMTQAEAIFFSLAIQAATPDLKAKKLLFDVLVKLQQANICFTSDRLPEIQLDEGEAGASSDVAAAIDQVAAAIGRDTAAPEQPAGEALATAESTERPPEIAVSPHPPRFRREP
ncbi:MAG: hypothetical protein JO213_14315 [Alphaproteobacteria bacterium]|nr:hypothetical protein [Alphaproteobacteria bacterium]MBV9586046.1 hypothetical protein [Alphaproteobacteria bacterium]